jgi:hypothetical protein
MKTLFQSTLIALLLCHFLPLQAQQDCDAYFPLNEGAVFEMTQYSDKGKEESKTRSTVKDISSAEESLTATVTVEYFDKKGESTYTSEYGVSCREGNFHLDMRSMMNSQNMASMQGMQIDVEADEMAFPLDLSPGTELPDAHLKVSMSSSGLNMAGMQVMVSNRKVLPRESITTPAGTFDCTVITQDVETKMIVSIKASSKTWYAQGAGVVRSESYNKNGKLMGYQELTSLKK